MKYLLTGLLLCCCTYTANAQHVLKLTITDKETQQPLAGAGLTWKEGNKTIIADSTGHIILSNISNGPQHFTVSFTGYAARQLEWHFPLASEEMTIALEAEEADEDEYVVVMATRTSRSIANTPTRIEIISGEELEEKGNMKPGDIRMLLNESTGIQTQQTSATSYNAGIRIQGLDGRYTQILRDGYPLYGGYSGGLSLLQIAPLDLKQVEVIKGSASTLYGGGAIAGLVNLVSRTPGSNRVLDILANGTSAGGLDLSSFYSEKYGRLGLTVFGSRNSNKAYDPAGNGFSAIPEFERYTIQPRLFLYSEKTNADISVSYVNEDRTGGSMDYIKNGGNGFYEQNKTSRTTAQFGITHRLAHATLQLKSSYTSFDRSIAIPGFGFSALQQSSFSELTWRHGNEKTDWVGGVNFLTDKLREKQFANNPVRDYSQNTIGVFVQNTWQLSGAVTIESGLRGDHVSDYGFMLLPRASALFRLSPSVSMRVGGGMGYKPPTIFTEETERRQFQQVLPVNIASTRNERSAGLNWDINYRTNFGELGFAFNQLFFYTRLNQPLMMANAPGGNVILENATGYIDTRGMETNLRFSYADFKLFLGYTYTDAQLHTGNPEWMPLTARHRLNNVLMYELEGKLKIGLEAYYFGRQRLSDNSTGRSYWITGLMAEKLWDKFSLFINFENFSDTRQTKFGSIYSGSATNPVFKDIYAPLDGFVANGGIKIKL